MIVRLVRVHKHYAHIFDPIHEERSQRPVTHADYLIIMDMVTEGADSLSLAAVCCVMSREGQTKQLHPALGRLFCIGPNLTKMSCKNTSLLTISDEKKMF